MLVVPYTMTQYELVHKALFAVAAKEHSIIVCLTVIFFPDIFVFVHRTFRGGTLVIKVRFCYS